MGLFVKKPFAARAYRWHVNGDHPDDGPADREGKVVRYFRHPDVPGGQGCVHCERTMHEHGWIDTLEGGHTVCPGDWIITGAVGEHYPIKPEIFALTYRPYFAGEEKVRRFVLLRETDVSGVSGEGVVVHGIQFPDGTCAYRWDTRYRTTCVADSIEDIEKIHGHDGATRVVWLDPLYVAQVWQEHARHGSPAA